MRTRLFACLSRATSISLTTSESSSSEEIEALRDADCRLLVLRLSPPNKLRADRLLVMREDVSRLPVLRLSPPNMALQLEDRAMLGRKPGRCSVRRSGDAGVDASANAPNHGSSSVAATGSSSS